MDPSDAEQAAMQSLGDIAEWLTLTNPALESLLLHLGATLVTHPRVLAALDWPTYKSYMDTWQTNSGMPSATLLGQAGLMWRTARLVCGQPTSQRDSLAPDVPLSAPAPAVSEPKEPTVKLSLIADQMQEVEVPVMTSAAILQCYETYKSRMGAYPHADEELTAEQLSCLAKLFNSSKVPYVDFSLWGPHGYRMQKKAKMRGVRLGPEGQIISVEILGPRTFEEWSSCFSIFKTGCIMLSQITPARLENYRDFVKRKHQYYGATSWPLLYQAEVRARMEEAERLRREGAIEHEEARNAWGVHAFSPKYPWEWVYAQLPRADRFWKEQFDDPAMLIITQTASLSSMLGGDAPIERTLGPIGNKR
eukprot:6470463-Amphidinium_carterae.1